MNRVADVVFEPLFAALLLVALSYPLRRRAPRVAFILPGTNIRYGIDGIIGLIPVVGDIIATALSLWLVREARALGAPWYVTARMLGNVAIQGVVGAVPVAGDAFDLTLIPAEKEIRASGLTQGLPTTFFMSPKIIRGMIGECQFELVWGSGRYTGARNCGPSRDVVSLLVPAALSTWSDPEVAAMLVIISTRQ